MAKYLNGMELDTVGNTDLLALEKTAFLCSRKTSATAVLKCYDWAIKQRERKSCVISGFHSQLEKDVLHYLLKGTQPIILVAARGKKKTLDTNFRKAIDENRLLVLYPFKEETIRVTEQTALIRNQLIVKLADKIVVGYFSEKGSLKDIIQSVPLDKITFLS